MSGWLKSGSAKIPEIFFQQQEDTLPHPRIQPHFIVTFGFNSYVRNATFRLSRSAVALFGTALGLIFCA
jgi:hypothetical protein